MKVQLGTKPIASSSSSCLKKRKAHILWDRRWAKHLVTLGARVGLATLTFSSDRPNAGPTRSLYYYVHTPTNASTQWKKILETEIYQCKTACNCTTEYTRHAQVYPRSNHLWCSRWAHSEAICVPTLWFYNIQVIGIIRIVPWLGCVCVFFFLWDQFCRFCPALCELSLLINDNHFDHFLTTLS